MSTYIRTLEDEAGNTIAPRTVSEAITWTGTELAVGTDAVASGSGAIAIGNHPDATGVQSIAIGVDAQATGFNTVALGTGAAATINSSIAIGDSTTASAIYSIAIGDSAEATGTSGVAMGLSTNANGESSVAIGYFANATQIGATSIGTSSDATGTNSTAIGDGAQATGNYSTAIGYGAEASGASTLVLGKTGTGTPTIIIPSGQIQFPATQNASSDANTLDDYEEGTWTPDLQFGGAKVGITYNAQTGSYQKIGNRVYLTCFVALSNKGSSTGAARIYGLPFVCANLSYAYGTSGLWLEYVSFADVPLGITIINTSYFQLAEITNAGTNTMLDNTNFGNSSIVFFTTHYLTTA